MVRIQTKDRVWGAKVVSRSGPGVNYRVELVEGDVPGVDRRIRDWPRRVLRLSQWNRKWIFSADYCFCRKHVPELLEALGVAEVA